MATFLPWAFQETCNSLLGDFPLVAEDYPWAFVGRLPLVAEDYPFLLVGDMAFDPLPLAEDMALLLPLVALVD